MYFQCLPEELGRDRFSDEDDSLERLMSDDLDKDAYFVIRLDKKDRYLERYPELEVLYEKDGYVFTVKRAGLDGRW